MTTTKPIIIFDDKIFIDSKVTYYVAYAFDKTHKLISLNQLVEQKNINYYEFPYFEDADEFVQMFLELASNYDDRLLIQIIEAPIQQSTRYTNKLPKELFYN
jgi:hypothetical protein